MPAIANGGCQNTPEPLSCRGFGGIVEKNRVWVKGHRDFCDFSATFCRKKAPSCSRLVLGFLAPGVHGLKKAGVELRSPV